ncbi:MAG TPA: pitrilysin family protein, partial [Armatimonadota bacterium]|nr:pitrilysin family protein [Armatimonadota bacterium]
MTVRQMIVDPPVRETTLDNGIRVVTEYVPHAYGASVGLRVAAGARDEAEAQSGISHLLEHMLFKGTERRTARQIAEELDAVGGQMDAFTSKEYTGYGARVLPQHVPLALDVLADMLRHSLFDPAELELEKGVILEEYKSLEDAPEEYVHDVFSRTLWPDHPLGRAVIGRPEVITRLTREDLLAYLQAHYVPQRLICVAAGNLEHDELVREIDRQFGDLSGPAPARELSEPAARLERCLIGRRTEQTHFCMGTPGVDENHPERWAVRVLNLIVGGGMSSRLFQEIREKRGLCYSIGSESLSYRDAGMFVVYADTSPEQTEEVQDLTRRELLNVARDGLTEDELVRAREQVRASLLLSLDDIGSRMN